MTEQEWPKTIEEAAQFTLRALSEDIRTQLKATPKSEVSTGFHFSLGGWIRNNLGLYRGNQILLDECSTVFRALFDLPDILPLHADSASTLIIVAVWELLQGTEYEQIDWRSHFVTEGNGEKRDFRVPKQKVQDFVDKIKGV